MLICRFGIDEKKKKCPIPDAAFFLFSSTPNLQIRIVFRMRMSILNTATTEQMG